MTAVDANPFEATQTTVVAREVPRWEPKQGITLTQDDIATWIFHSGGPKVLEAVEQSLSLEKDALAPSWKSLREHGNLSAASVLTVLEDYLKHHPGAPGSYSILAAMGPGFCLELVLLQW